MISQLLRRFFPRFFKAAPPLVTGSGARLGVDGGNLFLDALENCARANEGGLGTREAEGGGGVGEDVVGVEWVWGCDARGLGL